MNHFSVHLKLTQHCKSTEQFSSVCQSYPTLCDPMDCSTPGFSVHHQHPGLAQIHGHQVGDAIQPSHPLSSPSPPAFNLSQHQKSFPMSQFFASGGQSIGVSASASVLPMNIQDWFPLGWTGWISLQSKGLSRVFSNTTVRKHQFSFLSNQLILQLKKKEKERNIWAFLVAQMIMNMPSETWVWSLCWEYPMEKGNGNPL